jgi:hypothetical protein
MMPPVTLPMKFQVAGGGYYPHAVGYEYDAAGRRSKLIYPDGSFVTYAYNANGWLTNISDGGMKHKKQSIWGKRLLAFRGWRARILFIKVGLSASLFRSVFPRMKTSCFVVALLAFGIAGIPAAQTSTAAANAAKPGPTGVPDPTAYRVIDAGANHRVWQNETYEKSPDGQVYTHIHTFKELCSGLNFLKAGQWVESKEQIEVLPQGGAAAVQGQHQAYFPSDIYNGFIELVTPDGQHLKSQPLGLSYDDGNNTVFIAVLTNSIGQLVGSNQVIYPDAFTGFKADLVYTYTKAGFEQDVILRAQPPTPESLGLNPATARLQVLTEFFSPPQPAIQARKLAAQAGLSLTDQSLGFGAMQMVPGRAFLLGNNAVDSGAQAGKQWLLLDERQFLVEEVPVDAIADELATLPLTAMQSGSSKASHMAFRHLALPPQRLVKNTSKTMMLAKAGLPAQGFVLDYQTVNTSLTNYTFQGDTTYYISGPFYSYGTNTFEGGTVIKFATNGSIAIAYGTTSPDINWKAGAYRPVIFTAKDDNTVGENVGSGNPTGYYGNPMLALNDFSPQAPLIGLRMSYAKTAIQSGGASANIYDAQFINCQNGLILGGANVFLGNALFANTKTNFIFQGGSTVNAQNATFNGSAFLASAQTYQASNYITLTNCILANVTNLVSGLLVTTNGSYNGFYNTPNFGSTTVPTYIYPFQTVGSGSYYLTNGCNFFNQGTTNIDATLLAGFKQRTTYPPIVYANQTISVPLTLSPQAQRDTNASDLGYHYDPLDYVFGGVTASSNLTFTAGTAVGWFNSPGGIYVPNDVTIAFQGTVTAPCMLAKYTTVQECAGGWTAAGATAAILGTGNYINADHSAQITANFTHGAMLSGGPSSFRDYTTTVTVRANNCEFWNGGEGGYGIKLYLTNCLLDRCSVGVQAASSGDSALVMRNCTIRGRSMLTTHWSGSTWPTWIQNCAFDGTDLSQMDNPSGGNTNILYCNYNAFLQGANRLPMLGTNDVIVTNSFNWQTGPLGYFYEPTNSPLINHGSTTADQVGLYHFTTQTNQTKEANSIVDVGYHYVAVDANGNPLDIDGDGPPDYLEDSNGNGIYDAGDLGNWLISLFNGLTTANGLQVFTPLK